MYHFPYISNYIYFVGPNHYTIEHGLFIPYRTLTHFEDLTIYLQPCDQSHNETPFLRNCPCAFDPCCDWDTRDCDSCCDREALP